MKNIILIGTSDLFEMTESSLDPRKYKIHGYLAPQKNSHEAYKKHTYLGDDSFLTSNSFRDHFFVVAVYDNIRREKIFTILESHNRQLINIIHPSSVVMPSASIEKGTTVAFLSTVSSFSNIGMGVVIRSHVHLAHDVSVGNFSFIAPGACILGGVQIGKRTLIGANATIFPNVKIGDNCTIGAGSILRHDIPPETKFISK